MQPDIWREKRAEIKACKRYIDTHIQEPLDLSTLARRYSYSYSAFRAVFKEVAAYTPHQYIRLRRVQLAAQLLREGKSVTEASEQVGFETLAGFYKAFRSVYGVSPQAFLAERGRQMMAQPQLREIADFCIVGYVLPPVADMRPVERGAYWIVQECPRVSAEEYARIGGGADMAALWVDGPDGGRYLIGPPVDAVGYVPEKMAAQAVAGGLFLEFPVPGPADTFLLYDNVRATWYYARQQFLPGSPWEEDPARTAFEYYGETHSSVLIPVKERHTEP